MLEGQKATVLCFIYYSGILVGTLSILWTVVTLEVVLSRFVEGKGTIERTLSHLFHCEGTSSGLYVSSTLKSSWHCVERRALSHVLPNIEAFLRAFYHVCPL